jgi:hypothetical protein
MVSEDPIHHGQFFGMAVFDDRARQGRQFLEELAHPGRSVASPSLSTWMLR